MAAITTDDAQFQVEQEQAENKAMMELYAQMDTLPPQTQMFMEGCLPEFEELRHLINCRELVMRNLLAFSVGVQKTVCWDMANEKANHNRLLHLLFDKFKIMEYEYGVVKKRYPAAETLHRLTSELAGMEQVRRIEIPECPNMYLFVVERRNRSLLYVVWDKRDTFSGEKEPPVPFEWSWPKSNARAVDVFGETIPIEVKDGYLRLLVSLTPVFIESNP